MITLISIASVLLVSPFVIISNADSIDYFVRCGESLSNVQSSITYQTNLRNLLSALPPRASNSGFYTSSRGQNPNKVYALYLCRADLDFRICNECVYQAQASIIQQCLTQESALIWYDECMLRFSNSPVFRNMTIAPKVTAPNPQNVSSEQARMFSDMLNNTVSGLVGVVAGSSAKFGTKDIPKVMSNLSIYAAEQCTPDLDSGECEDCLGSAIAQLQLNSLGGRVLLPSCYVRFEQTKWYGDSVNSSFLLSSLPKGKRKWYIAVAVTVSVVLAVLLLCGICYYYRYHKNQQPAPPVRSEMSTVESLQYDFRTIKIATNNFSINNKLGEGGFGVVYKGMLQNGQEIAVKRLSKNSNQGIEEFEMEVRVVARLQHRNLVRLLGFCVHKTEKLLIYEFLPNSSLDKVLLDKFNGVSLDWITRYKIIAGVARGLLYLHEDSRLKIIHRDLKSANVLLDESMNPKIADFGLAKLVGVDQSQADSTRNIRGTFGYMAPEYTKTGRCSTKSDVYSFGVIILEIISGHKCNSMLFPFHEEGLLEQAWRLWSEDRALDMVDLRLESNFKSDEVVKCIHIGLLCIQEDPNKRPTMAPIVSALNGHAVDLPAPGPPQATISPRPGSSQSSSTVSGIKDIVTDLSDPR